MPVVKLRFIKKFRDPANRLRTREIKVEINAADALVFDALKRLWDVEQTLNTLPGTDTRVHVTVEAKDNEVD